MRFGVKHLESSRPVKKQRTRLDQTVAISEATMAKIDEMDQAAVEREKHYMVMLLEHDRGIWEEQKRLQQKEVKN